MGAGDLLVAIVTILVIIVLIAISIVIFTFAWNETMPYFFGLPETDYFKTILLWIVLSSILGFVGKVKK